MDVYTITVHDKHDSAGYLLGTAETLEAAEAVAQQWASNNGCSLDRLRGVAGTFGYGTHTWQARVIDSQEADHIEIKKGTSHDQAVNAR